MLIVTYRKIYYGISVFVVSLAVFSVLFYGLNFGIEFTGGEIAEVSYADMIEKTMLESKLDKLSLGEYSLRTAGESGYILRTRPLENSEREELFATLIAPTEISTGVIERFNSVGPTIGKELRRKAGVALILTALAIILFVAFVFRHVSKPVASWKYGVIAIIALLHDIIVPIGLFAALGHYFGAEVNVLFVMALLAILGYSVNDTIVVFDRVREHLRTLRDTKRHEDFELVVGKALNQTYVRSVNTSLTTLFVLFALFFIGAPATQDFALVLIVGVIAGTYSSICLATPLLVSVNKLHK